MLEAYSTNVTVSANSAIPFTTIAIEKGDTVELKGTSSIAVNKCGIYEVTVDSYLVASAAGNIGFQLYKDGSPIAFSNTIETASDTTSYHSLSFSNYIQVSKNNSKCCCSSPTIITVVNNQAATYGLVTISVRRVC